MAWSGRAAARRRAGPPLGGLALALDGWQGVFLVRLPLLVVPLVVGWCWIPARRRASGSAGFDLSGAALLCASPVALAWLLNGEGSEPATSGGLVAVVAALAAAFTWRELRHPGPVLDLRLFRGGPLSTASGVVALSNLAMYVTLLALSVPLSRGGLEQHRHRDRSARRVFVWAFALSRPGGACRTGWAGGSPPPSGWA